MPTVPVAIGRAHSGSKYLGSERWRSECSTNRASMAPGSPSSSSGRKVFSTPASFGTWVVAGD